ncbi:hypothetical protein QOT17_001099, partial [Balamuthia mandrillaris]
HLLCKHGLDLREFHNWRLTDKQKQTSLWGWSRDTLNAKLQDRAVRAGYPEGLFSFHSLRAGFLCTALILEGLQEGHSQNNVLDTTALIAGWVPRGRSQQVYVKDTLKRAIVANRLVSNVTTLHPSSSFSSSSSSSSAAAADHHSLRPRHCVIAPELVTKEAFHNLSPEALQQSKWSADTNYQSFIHAVRQRLSAQLERRDLPTKDQQIRFYRSLWLECCTAWVDNHSDEFDKDVLAEAAATYEAKNKSPLRWPNIHRQLCRQHISGILQGFFSGLNELVDEFVAPVLPKLVNGSPIHKAFLTSRRQEQPFLPTSPNDVLKKNDDNADDDDERNHNSKEKTPPRQRVRRALQQRQQMLSNRLKYQKNGHRQRIAWQTPEIRRLVTWRLRDGWSWLEIAKHLPTQRRTNNDCYDKWRNLLTEFFNNLDALKDKYLVAHDEDFDTPDDNHASLPSSPTSTTTTTVISILDEEEETKENDDDDDDDDIMIISS